MLDVDLKYIESGNVWWLLYVEEIQSSQVVVVEV
jgi:hypothetical protein